MSRIEQHYMFDQISQMCQVMYFVKKSIVPKRPTEPKIVVLSWNTKTASEDCLRVLILKLYTALCRKVRSRGFLAADRCIIKLTECTHVFINWKFIKMNFKGAVCKTKRANERVWRMRTSLSFIYCLFTFVSQCTGVQYRKEMPPLKTSFCRTNSSTALISRNG